MRTLSVGHLCLALLLSGGCRQITDATWTSDGGFSARAGANGLILRNRTGDAVNYTLAEERTATVLELPVDPENWPTIEHGQDVLASL